MILSNWRVQIQVEHDISYMKSVSLTPVWTVFWGVASLYHWEGRSRCPGDEISLFALASCISEVQQWKHVRNEGRRAEDC